MVNQSHGVNPDVEQWRERAVGGQASPPRLYVTLGKNSRGLTWEVSYSAEDPAAVFEMLRQAVAQIERDFGQHDGF
jgi:hypothetical protein